MFSKGLIKNHMTYDENANADDYIVKYDSATGLFTNKAKDIAFKDVVSARKHNEIYEPYSSNIQKIKKELNASKQKPFVKPQVKPKVTPQVKPTADKTPINLNYNDDLTRMMKQRLINRETDQQRIQRENFEKILRDQEARDLRNRTTGIAYLMGSPEVKQKGQKEENMNVNTNERGKYDL